jgi:hypothetical protein
MKTPISTEGRVFAAQLTRDLHARELAGAEALAPGSKTWQDAFRNFGFACSKAGSPSKVAKMFRGAVTRMLEAQTKSACWVNFFSQRSRSANFEVLTYEVLPHPLTGEGNKGIVVKAYTCFSQRTGRIAIGKGDNVAFVSWHALGRMKERSNTVDIFAANGIAALCGIAGVLMRESKKHINTEINFAVEDMLCTGVLRYADDDDNTWLGFYDVITALPIDEAAPKKIDQGCAIAWAVHNYVNSKDADPTGYGDKIAVLPFHERDYISRVTKEGAGA